MAYQQKQNAGSLFINDRKTQDNHPDLNGSININGVDYWLSAWQKTANSGAQFYSLSVKPKEQKRADTPRGPRSAPQPASDIPSRFDDL